MCDNQGGVGRLVWEGEGWNLEGELLDLEDLVELGPRYMCGPF